MGGACVWSVSVSIGRSVGRWVKGWIDRRIGGWMVRVCVLIYDVTWVGGWVGGRMDPSEDHRMDGACVHVRLCVCVCEFTVVGDRWCMQCV